MIVLSLNYGDIWRRLRGVMGAAGTPPWRDLSAVQRFNFAQLAEITARKFPDRDAMGFSVYALFEVDEYTPLEEVTARWPHDGEGRRFPDAFAVAILESHQSEHGPEEAS